MNKKILISFIIISLFMFGCSKNNDKSKSKDSYDPNSENEIEIVTQNNITVTGTKIVTDGDNRYLKAKIVNNQKVECDTIVINIKDIDGNIIKTSILDVDGIIAKGKIISLTEDYTNENRTPYYFEIIYSKDEE